MKIQLSYPALKEIARSYAMTIPQGAQLVAIARGGLTFAHLVAYFAAKPLGFLIPGQRTLVTVGTGPIIFLEDLIAKGRTLLLVEEMMASRPEDWMFTAVIQDSRAQIPEHLQPRVYALRVCEDWVVFPYEHFESVVEGDWGLFRERTSQNSIPQGTK